MIVETICKETKMIVLRAENVDEKALLDSLGEEGVMVCVTGSVLGIVSPMTSGQVGVYLDRSQQSALAFALGLADYAIVDTDVNNTNLLQKLTEKSTRKYDVPFIRQQWDLVGTSPPLEQEPIKKP